MPSFVRKRSYGSVKVYWLDKEGLVSTLKRTQDALECFPLLEDSVFRWTCWPLRARARACLPDKGGSPIGWCVLSEH